jgi:undecaprenyl-diphosphatase
MKDRRHRRQEPDVNLLEAIILGLVEGITEYLPVSSTGHLVLAAALLGLNRDEDVKHAVDTFTIVIQGGAILAVLGLYRARVAQMIRGLLGRDRAGATLAANLLIAFAPAAVFGVLLDDWIEGQLFWPIPVLSALALGGVAMIGIGRWQRAHFHEAHRGTPSDAHAFTDIEHLAWRQALLIGLLQCVAMWPGTSRSMMTIVGGMMVGLRPKQAAEFSFLLGLPTLGGACAYKLLKSMRGEVGLVEQVGWAPLLVGVTVSAVAAALAVQWLVRFLTLHGLAVFGWYRLGLCAVMAALICTGRLTIAPERADESASSSAATPHD